MGMHLSVLYGQDACHHAVYCPHLQDVHPSCQMTDLGEPHIMVDYNVRIECVYLCDQLTVNPFSQVQMISQDHLQLPGCVCHQYH